MTCTSILMEAMEDFGVSEPEGVVIVYVNTDGELVYKSNLRGTYTLGLLRAAEQCVADRIVGKAE